MRIPYVFKCFCNKASAVKISSWRRGELCGVALNIISTEFRLFTVIVKIEAGAETYGIGENIREADLFIVSPYTVLFSLSYVGKQHAQGQL